MLKNVRENSETLQKAKEQLGSDKLPAGLLGLKGDNISTNIKDFIQTMQKDKKNESFPVATFQRRQSELQLKKVPVEESKK